MSKFKIGQKVRCKIDGMSGGHLMEGEVYTVIDVLPGPKGDEPVRVNCSRPKQEWSAARFKPFKKTNEDKINERRAQCSA